MGILDVVKQPTNQIFLATIVECLPTIGHAVVLPASTTILMNATPVVATLPFADSRLGVSALPMYSAGATVVCFRSRIGGEYIVHILGTVNVGLDMRDHMYETTKPYNADKWCQSDKSALSQWRLLEKLCPNGEHVWARTRAHGASGDALPGDYDAVDRTGLNGLHIGRMFTQLRGSAMSFMDASTLNSGTRLVGDVLSGHTLTHESVVADGYVVSNTAIDLSEAFGVPYGTPAMKINQDDPKNQRLELMDDKAIPLYRLQHMAGSVVDGVEDVVLAPREDAKKHDKNNEPYVLARRRMGLDGALSNASAHSLLSVKGPVILAAMQTRYATDKGEVPDTQDDLREAYPSPQAETEKFKKEDEKTAEMRQQDEDRVVDDAALNKLIDTLLEGDYREALLRIMAKKGFSRASKEASLKSSMEGATDCAGATTAMEYKLPASVQLTDPVTGEQKTYYDTMSFISQEPDGSICLCDGYGSEIRMSRGNIYISPALDCIVRPGRDMSVMAGRHQSYNSQQTCTINSTTNMHIRAVKDLLVAGATGKKGKLVLECDNERHDAKSGLVIKSKADMSVTAARNVYMGINKAQNMTEGGVAGGAGGGIILDALEGMAYIKGSNVMVDANKFMACASTVGDSTDDTVALSDYPELSTKPEEEMTQEEKDEYKAAKELKQKLDNLAGAALIVETGKVELASAVVNVSGDVRMKESGKQTVDVYRGKSVKKVRLTTAAKPGIICEGNIHTNNSISAHVSVSADSASFRTGSWHVAGSGHHCSYWLVFTGTGVSESGISADIDADMGAVSSNMRSARSGAYQDAYITKNAFSFPTTYSVDASAAMPGMVWQDMSRLSGLQGDTWHETWIKAPGSDARTACYPGYDVWSSQQLSVQGYTLTYLKSGYIVNSKLVGDDIPENNIT